MVVFFAALVAKDLTSLGTATAVGAGVALALACLVVAGTLGRRGGFAAGWVLQVLVVTTGVWVPAMIFLGVLFAALWVGALRLGARIERERARASPR
jgi:hypothetical protein